MTGTGLIICRPQYFPVFRRQNQQLVHRGENNMPVIYNYPGTGITSTYLIHIVYTCLPKLVTSLPDKGDHIHPFVNTDYFIICNQSHRGNIDFLLPKQPVASGIKCLQITPVFSPGPCPNFICPISFNSAIRILLVIIGKIFVRIDCSKNYPSGNDQFKSCRGILIFMQNIPGGSIKF